MYRKTKYNQFCTKLNKRIFSKKQAQKEKKSEFSINMLL